MEPVAAITLAKTIISKTGLGRWISKKVGKVIGEKTAHKVVAIAQQVTGVSSVDEVLDCLSKDKAAAIQVRNTLMQNEHTLQMTMVEDRQNARAMYVEKNEMADAIAERVIRFNHWVVVLLILANCAVAYYVQERGLALALGNLISLSIGALWQERQQVVGFFFGSSLGSKQKSQWQLEQR